MRQKAAGLEVWKGEVVGYVFSGLKGRRFDPVLWKVKGADGKERCLNAYDLRAGLKLNEKMQREEARAKRRKC